MANMGQKGVFWGVNSWTMWIEWMRVWPGSDPGGQKWSKGGLKGGPFLDPLFGGGSFWGCHSGTPDSGVPPFEAL